LMGCLLICILGWILFALRAPLVVWLGLLLLGMIWTAS
jgi:hypothetical protein